MRLTTFRTRSRFVAACQQLLALAVVLAVLTPAMGVVSLDVVREAPHGAVSARAMSQSSPASSALVAAAPAEARPREVPLTGADRRSLVGTGERGTRARGEHAPGLSRKRDGSAELVSPVERFDGEVGVVGLTWSPEEEYAEEDLTLQVRTRTAGQWSKWLDLHYDDTHRPDADSTEARQARPGTDEAIVGGTAEQVQVRVRTSAGAPVPADLRLAVVEAGPSEAGTREAPEIDTSALGADDAGTPEGQAPGAGWTGDRTDAMALRAASYTQKPRIFSRRQWGANESWRNGNPSYYEVHGGFMHHTVNANGYTRDQVPGLMRSIYAYHTRNRGWSDIGYNFVVDRFGRIWEGRAGGVDRPVVGAHTAGYNSHSFAASALGNFETARPSTALVQAMGRIFAWKLSLHGVDAKGTHRRIGSRTFAHAINGHRDAGSTACPGRYLYAQLDTIRTLAKQHQSDWTGRDLTSDLAGSEAPDLIGRRKSDGRGIIIPVTDGVSAEPHWERDTVGRTVRSTYAAVLTPSVIGDDRPDLLVMNNNVVAIRPGKPDGTFASPVRTHDFMVGHVKWTALGDVDGNGHHDLIARKKGTDRIVLFRGRGEGRFERRVLRNRAFGWYRKLIGAGDVTGDGNLDVGGLDHAGRLWIHPGKGNGWFRPRIRVAGDYSNYNAFLGLGDYTGDDKHDLLLRRKGGDAFVLPGRGDGTFADMRGPYEGLQGIHYPSSAGDFGGTPLPDFVGRTNHQTEVVSMTSRQTGDVPIETDLDLSFANKVRQAGDWDRDGHSDLLVRGRGGWLWVYFGRGDGRFPERIHLRRGGWNQVRKLSAVGDMTGDGYPDLLGQPEGGVMRVYPGNGKDGLRADYRAHSPIGGGNQVAVGLWNNDGAPDTVVRNRNRLVRWLSNGPGGLLSPHTLGIDVSPYNMITAISDVDGNPGGRTDLVVREKGTGKLYVLPRGSSGFGERRLVGTGADAFDLLS